LLRYYADIITPLPDVDAAVIDSDAMDCRHAITPALITPILPLRRQERVTSDMLRC